MGARSATVPMPVLGARPFVDLSFRRPDRAKRLARFWMDTGGGSFILTEPLARDLGLDFGAPFSEEGMEWAELSTPDASVGEFSLDLTGARVIAAMGKSDLVPSVAPGHPEGLFPGHVLARYHVVFDYPGEEFTIAEPGALEHMGAEVPVGIHPQSGFPRIELEIDGQPYGFLLDTGASYTMVSGASLRSWAGEHPDWARFDGPVKEAKTLGGPVPEATIFVPEVRLASMVLRDVGMVERPEGVFERWMTSLMTAPVIGALAGNVLTHLRLDIDYPSQQLRVS